MRYRYIDNIELNAPLHLVGAALHNPETWTGLSVGVERLGEYWQIGDELYNLEFSVDGQRFRWAVVPAAGSGVQLQIDVELHDAILTTHATVQVDLAGKGRLWPWERAGLHSRLRHVVRSYGRQLSRALRERSHELVLEQATLRTPITVQSSEHDAFAGAKQLLPAREQWGRGTQLAEELAARYPRTVEHFSTMGALDHLERVWRLDQGWQRMQRGEYDADCHVVDHGPAPEGAPDYELIYAGGGLGLLHAAVMAQRYGRKVMVFDRGEVGCAHREWNISQPELQALVDLEVVSWDELQAVVMRKYRDGLVRFHNRVNSDVPAVDLWLPEVLNVALDAGALLRLMRRKVEEAGGVILSQRSFRRVRTFSRCPGFVEVELESYALPGMAERHSARLLLDGMGSTSPLAMLRHAGQPFAGVCPTVGTVASGFVEGSAPDEVDFDLGDILLSIADAQRGEQLMWEGFPGRNDELTVYLFYYATIADGALGDTRGAAFERHANYSLLDLFEQYFTLLPSYKRPGPRFRHHKPVYGFIPARHSLRRHEASLLSGVLPVGDSAAQQSPLTFCGFGSHVRNLDRTTSLLDYVLRCELFDGASLRHINASQVNVSLNWIFSRFMHPWDQPHDVNRLQNVFLDTLRELGSDVATRFFQDRMRWSDYHPMLLGMLRRYWGIIPVSWRVLGPAGVSQWASDYLWFSLAAAQAALARQAGPLGERLLRGLADMLDPRLGLSVRAQYAEWRAMGWL